MQKHEQQIMSMGPRTAAASPTKPPGRREEPKPPARTQPTQERPHTPTAAPAAAAPAPHEAHVTANYEEARREQEEIDSIKSSFVARVEERGRQATMRIKTMGEIGLAAYQEGAKKANTLPDDVYIPPRT